MIPRRQLPAYSPLNAAGIRRAVVQAFGPRMNGQAFLAADLEREYSADRAILLGSGTQALQVAIELAMQTVDASAVALPAFTCFDVATAAVGARARIGFYDLDPSTLSPDMESLERALKRGTRIAVITPLYGFPVDWDALADLLARYGAIAVEDAAQGHHAEWRGRRLGSLGPISVLSFGRGKGWTGGSGGALLVRDQPPWQGLSTALKRFTLEPSSVAEVRVLGALAAQWALGRPEYYGIPHALPWLKLGETVYHDPVSPRRMTRAASACLEATLAAAAIEGPARRARAGALLDALDATPEVRAIRPLPGSTPGYLRFPLRLARGLAGFSRPADVTRLGLARAYPAVLPAIPQIRSFVDEDAGAWPGSDELVRTLFTAPTHSLLSDAEQATLIRHLRAYR